MSRDSSDNANRAEVVEKEEKSELRITLESPPATTACVEAASPVEESETPASLESIGVQPRSSVELLDSLLITDSWRLANKRSAPLDIPTPPSKDSSSDSVFTDPDEHPVSSTVTKDRRKTMAPPIPITTHKKVQLASPSQLGEFHIYVKYGKFLLLFILLWMELIQCFDMGIRVTKCQF